MRVVCKPIEIKKEKLGEKLKGTQMLILVILTPYTTQCTHIRCT